MKKFTLLLIFLFSLSGYCQVLWTEDFETTTGTTLPTGWKAYQNAVGPAQQWKIATFGACEGGKTAQIDREGVALGATSEDFLVAPLFTVPADGQVRFIAKQNYSGNQGGKFQVRVSIDSNPASLVSYLVVGEWTESEVLDSDGLPACIELKASLSDYAGAQVYLAFVSVFTRTADTGNDGDRWSIDDISLVSQCMDPTKLAASNIGATSATLDWEDEKGSKWEIEYVKSGELPDGNADVMGILSTTYDAINLEPDTEYSYYVRSVCSETNSSSWAGPFPFKTFPLGVKCTGAIPVTSLPYQTASNTANFADLVEGPQDQSSCGANPSTTDYLAGNDVFYSYTATETGLISIKLTPTGPNSSVFVYSSCPTEGPCLAGAANANSDQRYIKDFPVTQGSTYIIVISSSKDTQTVGYTLVIQKEPCTPPVGSSPTGADITTTTANLSWSNPTGATAWQVAVQPLGSSIPLGEGENVSTNPFLKEGLKAGTKYQYVVRSKCPDGQFSSWAGPYPFNTLLCDEADKCDYSFKMTDTGANGWGDATMQVRQNGIVVATIGPTFTGGAGPVTVTVPLCNNLPFDLYWEKAGMQPAQCGVAVINKFGQTLFTKVAGSDHKEGEIIYDNIVNCDAPVCDIPPISLEATDATTHGATLNWSAPATTSWDVYVVPEGSDAPNVLTVPTYKAVTTNPLMINGLLADTCYDYYVRVVCNSNSNWSAVDTFCTLPTCPRPVSLSATGATKTGATLEWERSEGDTATEWEILLVKAVAPAYGVPAVPSANYVLKPGDKLYSTTSPVIPDTSPTPFMANDLETATIYYYYIRTICTGTDKSVWQGPEKFNTLTCGTTEKCNYKFVMSDIGADNGWETGRMAITQNGISVAKAGTGTQPGNIGSQMTSSKPVTATVSLCDNVPFELTWTVGGANPGEIGVKVLNPYGDPIYTKLPGEGKPLDLLFKSVVNCTPPSCPKPSSLTIANITSTTADLGWIENATPGATEWEVYAVPSGTMPPINGSPVTGVKPYYKTNKNPFTITNLEASTTYDFYVRSLCSTSNTSTWTLQEPKTFTTVPLNDECGKPIVVPVNSDENCVLKASGNTKGASASFSGAEACQGFGDDDVWFSFVATSKIHVIDLNNIVGNKDLNHTLYSGSDCATQTQLYCSNPETSVATGLTIGNTYKIRVYTNEPAGPAAVSATFDICITTPPPVVNDDCDKALVVDVNDDLECGKTTAGSLTGASASSQEKTCVPGNADDDVWFKFVANTLNHYIILKDVTGSTTDINHAVYTGNCGNLVLKMCSDSSSLSSKAKDFVPGQTYYVRVWSNSAASQKVNFNLCVGSVPPPIKTSTNQYTTRQLIEEVLLGTKCANVANIMSSTGTNYSSVNGIGYFEKSLSAFPFKNGIVLSSGNALSVPGPNLTTLSEGSAAWPGDDDLEAIIKPAVPPTQAVDSYNASVLEFDFTPLSPKMSFNFLLASDEYGSFQCSYADAFAFILTGPDPEGGQIIAKNLAVLPDTKIPVSILTIRDDAYNSKCPSQKKELFGHYFLGDQGQNDPLGAPINFNGMTVPLKAKADVVPGAVYHIKMVIADNKDQGYDSAVFLEGGSFEIGRIDFGADLLISTKNALCPREKYVVDSGLDPELYTFVWLKDNEVIGNQTGPSLEVDSAGTYTLQAHYLAGTCDTDDSIVIEYYPNAEPGTASDMAVCGESNTVVFDLTTNSASILSPYNGDHTVDYYTSSEDAAIAENAIADPASFQNTETPQTIYARVSQIEAKCFDTVPFTVTAQLNPEFTLDGVCVASNYELTAVPVDNTFDPVAATYVWTAANGGGFNQTDKKNVIVVKGKDTYNVKVTTPEGCFSEESTTVTDISCSIQKGISPGSKNNAFELAALDVKRLEIFNRYGSEVYSLDNYTNQWHGQTNDGSDLPDGTYFYQIHQQDNKVTTGWIYINRKQ